MKLDTSTPQGRWLLSALAQIAGQIDDDAEIGSMLIGTRSTAGEEIHYYVVRWQPGVQRVMMLPDSPEAAQARELLEVSSIRLTAPDTPESES